MKQLTNITRTTGYLNKVFKLLNEEYFDNELEAPVITIQSTPKAYGHFTPWESWTTTDKHGNTTAQTEINIGAGTLDRPIENVVATLLHEMVHYYCYVNGIKDTSNKGRYHNRRFKVEAEKRGLHLDCADIIGWSVTSPTEKLIDFIIANDLEDIRISRNEWESYFIGGGAKAGNTTGTDTTPTAPKKGSSIKWVCPCCGTIIRSTREVNVICGDCGEKFIKA